MAEGTRARAERFDLSQVSPSLRVRVRSDFQASPVGTLRVEVRTVDGTLTRRRV